MLAIKPMPGVFSKPMADYLTVRNELANQTPTPSFFLESNGRLTNPNFFEEPRPGMIQALCAAWERLSPEERKLIRGKSLFEVIAPALPCSVRDLIMCGLPVKATLHDPLGALAQKAWLMS